MEHKAHIIRDKAKDEIIKFVIHKIGLISKAYGHDEKEEGIFVDESELAWNPNVVAVVDNSYLDVYDDIYEHRKVTFISAEDEGFVETEEGDVLYLKNLDFEDLVAVADCVEDTYNSIPKNS